MAKMIHLGIMLFHGVEEVEWHDFFGNLTTEEAIQFIK